MWFKGVAQIVLVVDAHEMCAEVPKLAHRALRVVDEHPGPSVAQDFPSNANNHGLWKIVLRQPLLQLRGPKLALHNGTVALQSHTARVRTISEQQADGTQQNALS